MRNEDSYDLQDALEALYEKCLDGYRISIVYDPRDKTSWLTWAHPGAAANSDAGRGHRGVIFEPDVFRQAVRQFILDATRIKNLHDFRRTHEPPTLED